MNNTPLVTISFPVYGGNELIADSLKSILQQDYPNIEYLVVDDKGTTNAMAIVEPLLAQSGRNYKIIHHPQNLGLGYVRNTSIDYASGEYLFFMDSDDLLTRDCISKMVKTITDHRVNFVGASSVFQVNGIPEKPHIVYPQQYIIKDKKLLEAIYCNGINISSYMWNKLYNLRFLRENNIRCTHPYIEDFHFSFMLFSKAKSCVLLPDITYEYVIHDNCISRKLLGNNGIPKKTADIATEIVEAEYTAIADFGKGCIREKALINTIGFGIMYLYKARNSNLISKKEYINYTKRILGFPRLYPVDYSAFRKYEKRKHIYYRVLQCLPYALKLQIVKLINYPHYRKRGIN